MLKGVLNKEVGKGKKGQTGLRAEEWFGVPSFLRRRAWKP